MTKGLGGGSGGGIRGEIGVGEAVFDRQKETQMQRRMIKDTCVCPLYKKSSD